jgi:hypothetical protein
MNAMNVEKDTMYGNVLRLSVGNVIRRVILVDSVGQWGLRIVEREGE